MENLFFITNSFITGTGGVASYAHDFVNVFKNLYHITVITNDSYQKKSEDDFEVKQLDLWNFSSYNLNNTVNFINSFNPDIIVNSYAPVFSLIVPYLNNEIRVLSISHLTNEKIAWFAGFNSKYYDAIVVLSLKGKEFMESEFPDSKNKNKIIYNFFEKPNYSSSNLHKSDDETLKIVFPGGMAFHKSPEIVCRVLLRLLSTNLKFNFYWLGESKLPGSNYFFTRTKTLKDILPKDDRIIQIGKVERSKANEIISDANIFLLPSRNEGCPISLMEAMSYGCIPIISDSKHGSLDIISSSNSGIIVKQNDDVLLFDVCRDIIENHSKYKEYYAKSEEYYITNLSRLSWEEQMKNVLNIKAHNQRIKYNRIKAFFDILNLRRMLIKDYLINKLRYTYFFFLFRYIKYIQKKQIL